VFCVRIVTLEITQSRIALVQRTEVCRCTSHYIYTFQITPGRLGQWVQITKGLVRYKERCNVVTSVVLLFFNPACLAEFTGVIQHSERPTRSTSHAVIGCLRRIADVLQWVFPVSVQSGCMHNRHGKRAYRIGIDALKWCFQVQGGREGENPELRTFFFGKI